jgi:hypothetical protein
MSSRRKGFIKASIFINKMQVYVHIMVTSFSLFNFSNIKKVIKYKRHKSHIILPFESSKDSLKNGLHRCVL